MKKILIFLTFCLTLIVSQAQQNRDYPLFADKVVEYGYLVEENVYYIIYRDSISFPDFTVCDEGYFEETYISIECEEKDFFNYLFWFAEEKNKKSDIFYKADKRYVIREVFTKVEGGLNVKHYLVNLIKS